MTIEEKKSLFIIKKVEGSMIAGGVLWFSTNFFLYFLGSLFTSSWIMPRYLLFLVLVNIIGGAIMALLLFNSETEE